MNSTQYGAGGYTVSDASGNIISQNGSHISSSADFQDIDQENFNVDNINAAIINNSISISVYPNPVRNTLNIEGELESVEIYDVFGKLVLTSTKNTINTSDLANGIYVLNINTNNSIITKRITVTK